MDEWILDDLLECSVCLERLDTSSKVLPCQHTFCKKCLEEILRTQAELRCPECRILVDTKIDDLPPNVLLMRILEGLGGASKRTVVRGGGSIIFSNTTIGPNENRSTTNVQQQQPQQQQQLQQQQSSHHHHHHHHHAHPHIHHQLHNDGSIVTHQLHGNQPCARATYDYISKEPGDLSFKKGDIIHLRKKIDSNWYHGECNGNHGVFPLSYVQIMVPLTTHIQAQCRALYDFKMGSDEEDGCLEFHKGDIITVMRRVDENWAEGKLGDKIGIFPLAFVELNSVAKALIKPHPENQAGPSRVAPPTPSSREDGNAMPSINLQQQSQVTSLVGFPAAVSDSSSTSLTSPSSSCSSSTPTTSSNHSSPSSPPPPPAPNKRHSFGTSSLQNGNNMKLNRHSAEILNVPEGFIPAQNALNMDVLGVDQHCQLIRHGSQKHRRINSTDIAPAPAPPPGPQLQHSSLQLPASYVALYPYKPQKGDELELKRGAVYTVTERCQDGWFKGTAARGHKPGVFPGNYVAPAKSVSAIIGDWSLPALQAQVRGLCRTGVTNSTGSPRNNITPPVEPRSLVTYTKPTSNPVQSTIAVQPNQSSTTEKARNQDHQTSIIQTSQNASSTLQQTAATTTTAKSSDKAHNRDKKEKCGVSLMRRLASIKKSKSPPPTPYSLDNPVFEDLSLTQHVHIRSGSCPNQLLSSTNLETPHRIFSPTSSHRSKQRERPSISRIAPRMNTERSPTTGVEHRKCNSMDNQTMVTPQDLCKNSAGRLVDDVPTPNRINGDNIQPLPRAPIHDFPNTQPEQQQRQITQENTTSSCSSTSTTTVQLPPPPRVDSSINNDGETTTTTTTKQLIVATRRQQNVEQNVDPKQQQQQSQNLPQRIPTSHPGPHKIFTSPKNQSSGGGGGGHHLRERFLCIVPYPPNSEYELELRLGDVIYVHKKRDDGWYKGTQQRTGRTGLFPASFVQSF